MPNRDGKGPMGSGAMTGKGLGCCVGKAPAKPETGSAFGRRQGCGQGQGRGQGCGQGRGQGRNSGRGRSSGCGRGGR